MRLSWGKSKLFPQNKRCSQSMHLMRWAFVPDFDQPAAQIACRATR